MMIMGESRKGACGLTKSLANPKTMLKVGCWNVQTMYSVGKTVQITKTITELLLLGPPLVSNYLL